MTELFTLLGRVAVDTQEANESLDNTVDKAGKSESKLSSINGKIGNGLQKLAKAGAIILATTATVATTALVSLSTKAVQCYADYEQLVGGVETLFGAGSQSVEEYAESIGKSVDDVSDKYNDLMKAQDAVLDHANKAYETAGLSANEYMETVTSFSAALISSLEGDTVKAAEVADKAIVDMSDNANKMGSSMESIQNAYQGFAKQNYTMLDNLKLGYGGTKEEMQRLLDDAGKLANQKFDLSSYADIVEAIHVVQENMGIAGTTAKEAATTIQGSIGMMKASWTNFITGLADENADLSTLMDAVIESFVTVVDNIAPRVIEVLPKIVGAVEYIIGGIAEHLPNLISELLPPLMSGITTLISELITMIPSLLSTLAPVLVDTLGSIFEQISSSTGLDFSGLFNGIVEGASQMGGALNGVLPSIVSVIQQLIPPLLQIAQEIIPIVVGLVTELTPILTQVIDAVVPLIAQLLSELIPSLIQIVQAILPALTALLEPIILIIQSLCTVLSPIISILSSVISQIATMLIPVIQQLCDFITTVLVPIIQTIMTIVEEVIGWVVTIIQDNMTTIQAIFQSAFDVIGGIIDFFIALFEGDWQGMWDAVKNILQAGFDFRTNIFNIMFSIASSIISSLCDVVKNIFENIKNAILDKISEALNFVLEKFNSLPEPIKNALSIVIGFIVVFVQSFIQKIKETYEKIVTLCTTIKVFISTVMNEIWSKISAILESIKVTFSTKISAVVSTVKDKFDDIKNAITEKITAAKDAVSSAIDAIKGFFDFEWSLPELKLPHIKIDGEWDLAEGKIPSFGVEWYAKGAVLNQPTAFGINGNNLMVGGEAGKEAVAPIDVLQRYVAEAVASQNAGLIEILQKILLAIYTMNDGMKDNFIEALESMRFDVNKREFARLVKVVN